MYFKKHTLLELCVAIFDTALQNTCLSYGNTLLICPSIHSHFLILKKMSEKEMLHINNRMSKIDSGLRVIPTRSGDFSLPVLTTDLHFFLWLVQQPRRA